MTRDHTEGTDSGGTHSYDQPATQAERRAQLRNERMVRDGWQGGAPKPTTFFALEGLNDDELGGGRFAPRRGPDPMPQQPAHSPWSCDPVPIEPPLNERIDSLPDMTTRDGDNLSGAVPWQYGPASTEQHASYGQDQTQTPEPDDEPT